MKRRLPVWAIPAVSILWFCVAGLVLLPRPGLQNDELYFSGPLYYADAAFYNLQAGATKVPLMLMSYSGALKTWIYAALFEFFVPGTWSVRVPMLLTGMLTVWLTWAWVRRIAGTRAAAIATVLLATDSVFMMTNTFDWGPVAFQHVFLVGGLLCLQRWLERGTQWALALGFFLWGLGIWDKALLSWPLIGMTVACLCVFPRELFRRLRPRPLGIAVSAFLIGASPLVWYNVAKPGATATSNTKFNASELPMKVAALRTTVEGNALFGYMVYKNPAPSPRAPVSVLEMTSVWISNHLGDHRKSWMLPAYLLALLCIPFAWGTNVWRPLLFLLIAMTVEWLQMALNQGTGGAPHHVILLWPFPLAFAGIAFDVAARKIPKIAAPVICIVVSVFALVNVLNTNEYLSEFIVNGGAGGWTDAIEPLSRSLGPQSASWIGLIDWGYLYQLRMLHEGDLPLFLPPMPPDPMRAAITDPTRLFIQHTEDKQMFPGVNDRFRDGAMAAGFSEKVERVVRDRNGRPVFELFRFQPLATAKPLP